MHSFTHELIHYLIVIRDKSLRSDVSGILHADEKGGSEPVEEQTENVLDRLYKKYVQNLFFSNADPSRNQNTAITDIKSSYSSDKPPVSTVGDVSFSGINPIVYNQNRASVVEL